jgi:RNA polymerase sigma factor (sigma-70 family)
MPPAVDALLWTAFLTGDESAFEALFRTYYRELHGYGVRLTSDVELTEDCLQNLFQRLWHRRSALGQVAEVKPYLYKAMRHEVGAALKQQRRRSLLPPAYQPEFEVQYSPEDFLIAQQITAEQHARLLAALGTLSNRQREAIYLKFFDGFDYERIAEIMSLNQQSIRNLVYQSLKLLRRSLLLLLAGWLALRGCF